MGNGKKEYKPKDFESCKGKDVSAVIYANMLQHPAWQKLSKSARLLYIYMKLQLYGQKTIPEREREYFYFNQAMWKKVYHLYTNKNQFYKDRDSLIENGFIEMEEKLFLDKAIYKFSDKWWKE